MKKPVELGYAEFYHRILDSYNDTRLLVGRIPVDYIPSGQIRALARVTYEVLVGAQVISMPKEDRDGTDTG